MDYVLPLLLVSDPSTSSRWATPSADAELVAQLQLGNEDAFRTLVERYQDRIYRVVFALL